MPGFRSGFKYVCCRCLERQESPLPPFFRNNLKARGTARHFHRTFSKSVEGKGLETGNDGNASKTPPGAESSSKTGKKESGAMSRRLEELSEEGVDSSGRRAKRMIDESGFSEELKKRLEARIDRGRFREENQGAFSVLNMPSSAGRGTRDNAAALPWTGTEKLGDAALRMLDDAHKPLKGSAKTRVKVPAVNLDMRTKKPVQKSNAERLANARDKTSIYALSQDNAMSEKEREDMRNILRDRFQPGARPMPTSLQGLQSLASERIEDAIARGLFKNIPRGKGVNIERDYTASSPFLDTTEYFMNKIIQKQEVLPPWVEKQQEVTRTSAIFRARLRNDWKRHAARMIASKGGTLAEQIKRAEAYASAEKAANPMPTKSETLSGADETGGETRIGPTENPSLTDKEASSRITATEPTLLPGEAQSHPPSQLPIPANPPETPILPTPSNPPSSPLPVPFRDPSWERTELSYHTLALASLNNLTRSYNLMAPELAKKPYFSLPRELRRCFADVAPQVAGEILERARAPPEKMLRAAQGEGWGGGVLDRFGAGERAGVWETRRPRYGLKEFWKDLFRKGDNA